MISESRRRKLTNGRRILTVKRNKPVMSTIAAHSPPEQRVVMDNVPWAVYLGLEQWQTTDENEVIRSFRRAVRKQLTGGRDD